MNAVAVLIPVYRNREGLERSLRSLSDAAGGFDVVVVDDGSLEPIVAPSRLRDDVAVSLLRLDANCGIAGALNRGLDHIFANGFRYIARLDAGDSVARERFQRQAELLELRPACAVVGSFIEFVGADQTPLFCHRAPSRHQEIIRSLHVNNCILHSGSMLRAAALKEKGAYREDCPGAEDYELFLRMSSHYELAVIPEILTRCEYALNGLSVAGRRIQQRTRLRLQLQYFDLVCPQSYYGVARTLLAMLAPHKPTLRLKLALSSADVRRKPDPELVP
jgi:glycosyltransferase involved in cell wall biosynthesis